MTLPPLYVEGLSQRALLGEAQLQGYKLGLIEALLKGVLRGDQGQDQAELRSALQTALEVARWEMRPAGGTGPETAGGP